MITCLINYVSECCGLVYPPCSIRDSVVFVHKQSQQPGYIPPRPQQSPAEGDLVGRGRQRGMVVGATSKSQGKGEEK